MRFPSLLAMMPTNWTPGLLVLGAGVAVALFILFSTRKPASAAPAVRDERLADLDQRLQLLLDQLRGLDAERHQLGEAFPAEKARIEREAAAAMRARDEYLAAHPGAVRAPVHAPAAPAAGAASASAPASQAPAPVAAAASTSTGTGFLSPQLKGALWGAGVVLFFVAVGFALQNWQGEREENGIMTGRTPPPPEVAPSGATGGGAQGTPGEGQAHPGLAEALSRAKADPRDLEAASFASHELIRLQRFDEAAELTNQSLAVDPFHVETRIHREVLRATEGDFRAALDALGTLANTYPDAWEAHLFRGALALQIGESQVALESFLRFQREAPADEHPPQLGGAISMLRQRLGQ